MGLQSGEGVEAPRDMNVEVVDTPPAGVRWLAVRGQR